MLIEAFAIWPNKGQATLAIAGSNLTGVDTLDHVPGVTLDREAEYIILPPRRAARPATAPHDDDGDGA